MRKGRRKEAKLCHAGQVVKENLKGLAVSAVVTHATRAAESGAAERQVGAQRGRRRHKLEAGRAYDARDFVYAMRKLKVTPPVAQHTSGRRSRIKGHITWHASYAVSQPEPQAHRGDLRLDEDNRRSAQHPPPRHRSYRLDNQADPRRLPHRLDPEPQCHKRHECARCTRKHPDRSENTVGNLDKLSHDFVDKMHERISAAYSVAN